MADDSEEEYDDEFADDVDEEVEEEDEEEAKVPHDGFVSAIFTTASGSQVPVPTVLAQDGASIWAGDAYEWEMKAACPAKLAEVPAHLQGGTLLQCPSGAVGSPHSQLVVSCARTARLYVVVEVPAGKSTPCAARGTLASCLASGQRWLAEGEAAPTWIEETEGRPKRPELLMFSTFAPPRAQLHLPQAFAGSGRAFVVATPVVPGELAATITSSAQLPFEQAAMDEGVMPWLDRDHQYWDIPEFMKRGILFQGLFKDVAPGTTLTVRPNSAAQVFVITERRSGTPAKPSWAEDLAQTWQMEEAAPRWHDRPTMRSFSRNCPAGWALTLPPCHAPPREGPVFSVVVTPVPGQATAPLEVSSFKEESFCDVDLAKLEEGAALRRRNSEVDEAVLGTLEEVPGWMHGTLVRPKEDGELPSRFAVRCAGCSVVYALLPAHASASVHSSRWGNGWEPREEAPTWQPQDGGLKSRLAVLAKRVSAKELLAVPPEIPEEVLALVVKPDAEAFDASGETNHGLELARAPVKETGLAWTDRQNRLAWIPPCMNGGIQLRGPHELYTRREMQLKLRATTAFRVFVMIEGQYESLVPRDGGGLINLLQSEGWVLDSAPTPAFGDASSCLKLLSKRCPEGQEVLMPLCGKVEGEMPLLLMVMVVPLGPDRLGEELKRSFAAWDAENELGIGQPALQDLLAALCPQLDEPNRKLVVLQALTTPKGEVRKAMPHEEKILSFGAVGERAASPGSPWAISPG
ncbi:unnamed protein product [Effrenium voratum]|nr:unnamed protein product [Effrenium voratum]